MVTTKKGLGADLATIEQIPTADLVGYARNARTHSDEQIGQIAASIREFGFCNPVLIDAENTIIAGHGRVLAAGRMKLESVPCLRLTHLTDAQRRAYVIADNRIALSSGWDSELLANELSDLHADEFDMALLGFDADELETLLGFEAGDKGTNDPNAEWNGMPEFDNEQINEPHLIVYFASVEQKIAFSKQVNQQLAEETKFVWFPKDSRPVRQGVKTHVVEESE